MDSLHAIHQASQRILLVEDHPLNRALFIDYLQYHGYEVQGLADGEHFFATLQQFQPDLVLLDLKLPGTDGFDLIQQLRQSPQWDDLPVVVISALAFSTDRQRAMQLGACRYFIKPVNLKDLLQTIHAYVAHGDGASSSPEEGCVARNSSTI
jgi:DNA-binding response OmpR family regulator